MLIRRKMATDSLLITAERLHYSIGIMLECLDFKVNLLANGGNIAVNDHNGIVNGSYLFLKHFDIKLNGKKLYDCDNANHTVNIKNLLE